MGEQCPGCNAGLMVGRVNRYLCGTTFEPIKGKVKHSKQCLFQQITRLENTVAGLHKTLERERKLNG